ncbi:MAG: hypothetical protein K6B65_01405 [Bacilli bacterium]|nr:hypothetical protein [Bacilli bacterium]
MNKKILTVLSTSLLLLASCGGENSTSSSVATSEASSSEEEVSSSVTETSSEPEFDLTKPSHDGLPYVSNLDKLKQHEFKGRWIWESRDIADTHVAFRKHITLDGAPTSAILHLSAESKATVWMNGEIVAVDAVLKRGPTGVDSFYQDIDVTSFMSKGDNVLCILVHYWARSGNASVNSDKGGMIYDLEIDGETISSDYSTKVKRLQEYRNLRVLSSTGEYPERDRNTFLSEREIYYDARLEEDFASSSYDDSSWSESTEVALPGYLPYGDLYLGDIPGFTYEELKECEDIDGYIGKKTTKAVTASFALPENMQFLPYFELESETEGARIEFYTNTYRTQGLVSLMDDYVCKEGENAYQQLYWRSGYILYLDLPAGITLKKVGYRRTQYDAEDEGKFVCDDSDFNTLWQKSSNTMHICMRDTFMDCPERERSPYSGDSANQIAECLYATGEDGWKMVKKTYQTLSGWAKEDNVFQLRWPSTTSNECPMQNLAFIQTLPDYYHHTGDLETVKETFPILANYLKVWNLNDDGSVEYRNGTFMWTDWGSGMDNDLMENGWYYWALDSLNKLGIEIGNTSFQSFFEERMPKIKDAFYPKFKKDGGFSSGTSFDDRGNALAVLSGLCEEEDYDEVENVLNTVTNSSPYMERFVLEALGKMDAMDSLSARIKNRYRGMIDYEASTLWEVWSSKPADGTINHGWAGGPLISLHKYFAGILPTSGGYATYDIAPSSLLGELEAAVATPKGELSYTYEDGKMTINALDGGSLYLEDGFGNVDSISGAIEEKDGYYALSKGTATITFSE